MRISAFGMDMNSVFWGVLISFILLGIRIVTVGLVTIRHPLSDKRPIMSVMLTRGLVAAILATLPLQYGLPFADLYLNITLVVIIITAVFSTIGVLLLSQSNPICEE